MYGIIKKNLDFYFTIVILKVENYLFNLGGRILFLIFVKYIFVIINNELK